MKSTLDKLVKKTAAKLNYWQVITCTGWPEDLYLYPQADGQNVDVFFNGEIIVSRILFERIPGWLLEVWFVKERKEGTDNAR